MKVLAKVDSMVALMDDEWAVLMAVPMVDYWEQSRGLIRDSAQA